MSRTVSTSTEQEHGAAFESLLEQVREQLLRAQYHFDNWKGLWPTQEVVAVLNGYGGFFIPTREALANQFFINLCNATSTKAKAPSLYRVLKMVRRHSDLAPGLDVHLLGRQIRKQAELLERVRDYRNKRVAHWDTDMTEPLRPVRLGELERLLGELQSIFNEIHMAHKGGSWHFHLWQVGDVSN